MNRKLTLTLCSILALSGFCLPAEETRPKAISYNGWTSGNFWGGGYVMNVVLSPSNPKRCYNWIDMAGLYRSDDGGNTWKMLHGALPKGVSPLIRGISVDPRNADNIVVYECRRRFGKGHVLFSSDGGTTFQVTARANADVAMRRASGFILDRTPANPDELILADYDGVMKSTDNGKSWKYIWQHSLNPVVLLFDRKNPEVLYLSSPEIKNWSSNQKEFDAGFFRSDDGGKSWKKLSLEAPVEFVQSNSSPDDLYGVFNLSEIRKSSDKGQTWINWSKGLNPEKIVHKNDPYCSTKIYMALSTGKDFILAGNTYGELYRLNNGASEWEKVKRESVDPRDYLDRDKIDRQAFKAISSITVDPENQNHWYATDYYNVMQTFDAGKNWICTSTGMSQIVMKNGLVLPGTHDILVTLMDHSWFKTSDGGKTFSPYEGFGYELLYFGIAPSNPNIIYASGPRASVITRTNNGGKTWEIAEMKGLPPRKFGLPEKSEYYVRSSIAVDPFNSEKVYVAIAEAPERGRSNPKRAGVYVSEDGAKSWKQMSAGIPEVGKYPGNGFFTHTDVCGNELSVTKEGTPVCMSIVYNYVCRYDKTNKRWETVRHDESQPWGLADLQTDPFSKRIWLAAKSKGLLFSDDDGRTFQEFPKFPGNAGRMYFDRERHGRFTISSDEGLWLTEDGGENWYFYDFRNKQPGRSDRNIAILSGENILLITQESGVFYHRIERNEDGTPKEFALKKPEKKLFRASKFSRIFGKGILTVQPGNGMFEAGNASTALFSIPDEANLKLSTQSPKDYATLSCNSLHVKRGKKYTLSFQIRGDVKVIGYFNDPRRRDFMNYQTGSEWKTIFMEVIPGAEQLSISLLIWKQKGWFEIRDFRLTEQ